jgi:phosphatidylglycerol:prolipoprotein diacylglycerol transferase
MAALTYPNIDPVFFSIGSLEVRWYGLAYVAGFIIAGLIVRSLSRRWEVGLTDDDLLDIVLAGVIGLVVGARLGYVLFYGVGAYWSDPLSIVAFWDGGMSFHGGLVGILLAGAIVARAKGVPALRLFDLGAVGAPVGIFLGRIANFINGELWGRETDVPWAMVFPSAPGGAPRHPSQLYEALLEGLVLFLVLFVLSRRRRGDGFFIGLLFTLYGVFRILVEFFREPDIQLGFIAGPFTMGQLLTAPMVLVGVWLVWRAIVRGPAAPAIASDAAASGAADAAASETEDPGTPAAG